MDQALLENLIRSITNIAHKTVDGVAVGDVPSILMAIGYVLVAMGMSWLWFKATKTTVRNSYKGAKWLVTPTPMSDLGRDILCAINGGAKCRLDNYNNLMVGNCVECRSCESPWKKVTDIRVVNKGSVVSSVDEVLSRRESKKIKKQATKVRTKLLQDKMDVDAKERLVLTRDVIESSLRPVSPGPVPHERSSETKKPTSRYEEIIRDNESKKEIREHLIPVDKQPKDTNVAVSNSGQAPTVTKVNPIMCGCDACKVARQKAGTSS